MLASDSARDAVKVVMQFGEPEAEETSTWETAKPYSNPGYGSVRMQP